MTDILLLGFIILLIIQVYTFVKIFRIVKQLNKLLVEIRILFKQSGIFFQLQKNKVIKSNSCQYCKFRLSFIHIKDGDDHDNFYYKCNKHDIEITLSDTCKQFEREFRTI
jgi:hypothetical protein